jgi:hypothetical protein
MDRICTPCLPETFSAAGNSEVCSGYSDCAPGTYQATPPTAQSDVTCLACDPGTFSAEKNQISCRPWTQCPAHITFVGSPGTATSDQICSPCSANGCSHFCSAKGVCFDCFTHLDCESGLGCDAGACVDLGCGTQPYFTETWTSGPFAQFWSVDDAWDVGPAKPWEGGDVAAGTCKDPVHDHTNPGGNDPFAGVKIGNIAPQVVMAERSYITSAAVDTRSGPSPVLLEFYRWLNSDFPPFMANFVEVWDGLEWATVWSGPPAGGPMLAECSEWSQQVVDVTAFRNEYFRVRFGFVIEDPTVRAVGSWNIDDIRIANTLPCPSP